MVERGGGVGDASGLNLWAGQYFIFWTCITFTFFFFFFFNGGGACREMEGLQEVD